MQMKGVFKVLYITTEWLTRLAITNLLWILLNTPIIFVYLNIYLVKSHGEKIGLMVLIALLVPFIFFPATSAMVKLIKNWIIERQDTNIFKPFFKAYRTYYLKSMSGGFIITIIWILLIIDFYYLPQLLFIMEYILYFLFILLLIFTLYFFSSLTYQPFSSLQVILKTALINTIRKPFLSFFIAVISMIAVFISFNILTFLIPLLVGSFIALISCLSFYYVLERD